MKANTGAASINANNNEPQGENLRRERREKCLCEEGALHLSDIRTGASLYTSPHTPSPKSPLPFINYYFQLKLFITIITLKKIKKKKSTYLYTFLN